MKRITILILFIFFQTPILIFAQEPCQSLLLGQFFQQLKAIKSIKQEVVAFKKYSHFDFATFKPSNEKIVSDYVEVGFDKNNRIVEINHHVVKNKILSYSLVVYDFADYRIMLLKKSDGDDFFYTPTAILNMKNNENNYMINVVPQFDNSYDGHQLFENFPINNFNDISCLMELDKNLYPYETLKFSNGQGVLCSSVKYMFEKTYELKYEIIHFFIDPLHYYPDFKITETTCVQEIMKKAYKVEPNLILILKPEVYGLELDPLWIYNGAHRYEVVK